MSFRLECTRVRIFLVPLVMLLFALSAGPACAPASRWSPQDSLRVQQEPTFSDLDKSAKEPTRPGEEERGWETAATAVLFVLVILGSAALPVLLLL